MKKWLGITVVMVFALAMGMACSSSGDKYGEALEVNKSFADAMEAYVADLEKADSAEAVAQAVDAFAASVEKIAPRMKEISAKYPELKDPSSQPKDLKALQARSEAIGKKMAGLMMKTMKYMDNDQVKTAHTRLQKAMSLMM